MNLYYVSVYKDTYMILWPFITQYYHNVSAKSTPMIFFTENYFLIFHYVFQTNGTDYFAMTAYVLITLVKSNRVTSVSLY